MSCIRLFLNLLRHVRRVGFLAVALASCLGLAAPSSGAVILNYPSFEGYVVHSVSDSYCWLWGYPGGFAGLSSGETELRRWFDPEHFWFSRGVMEGPDGLLWVSDLLFDGVRFQRHELPFGVFARDPDEGLWGVGSGAVSTEWYFAHILSPTAYTVYGPAPGTDDEYWIPDFAVDGQGAIWYVLLSPFPERLPKLVRFFYGDVQAFEPKDPQAFRGLSAAYIALSSDAVWLADSGRVDRDASVVRVNAEGWTRFGTEDGLPKCFAAPSLAVDTNDVVWTGTHEGGVARFDGVRWQPVPGTPPIPSDWARTTLKPGPDGAMWLSIKGRDGDGYMSSVSSYSLGEWRTSNLRTSFIPAKGQMKLSRGKAEDSPLYLVFTTNSEGKDPRVWKISQGGVTTLELPAPWDRSYLTGHTGGLVDDLWLTLCDYDRTNLAVAHFDETGWSITPYTAGARGSDAWPDTSLRVDAEGRLWCLCGTEQNGQCLSVCCFDGERWISFSPHGRTPVFGSYKSLTLDTDGTAWITLYDGYLGELELTGGIAHLNADHDFIYYLEPNIVPPRSPIIVDETGTKWYLDSESGSTLYSFGETPEDSSSVQLGKSDLTLSYIDSAGDFWFNKWQNEAYKFDGQELTEIPVSAASQFLEDESGNMWVRVGERQGVNIILSEDAFSLSARVIASSETSALEGDGNIRMSADFLFTSIPTNADVFVGVQLPTGHLLYVAPQDAEPPFPIFYAAFEGSTEFLQPGPGYQGPGSFPNTPDMKDFAAPPLPLPDPPGTDGPTGLALFAYPVPYFANVPLPAYTAIADVALLSTTIPEGAPAGTYTFHIGITAPASISNVYRTASTTFEVTAE